MTLLSLTGIDAREYTVLEDGATPEEGATVAVPLARLQEDGDAVFATAGKVGVIVPTETAYSDLDAVAEKWRKKLETHKEMAFLCRDIARLQTDLHIDGNLQQLRLVR